MKIILRLLFLALACLCGLLSLLVALSAKQIEKNKMILADMRDCVRAIQEFDKKSGRLPTDSELKVIAESVPQRYLSGHSYYFSTPPVHTGGENKKGWMIEVWRSEWAETYTSWNNHFSVEEGASWWGFCGPLLFTPIGAMGFGVLFFRTFRTRKSVPS